MPDAIAAAFVEQHFHGRPAMAVCSTLLTSHVFEQTDHLAPLNRGKIG